MRCDVIVLAFAAAAAVWSSAGYAANPAPIGSGRLVYDEHRRRVMLLDAVAPSDSTAEPKGLRTWSWDGRTWTLLPRLGPGWRVANAAVYDARRRRVVMYGGVTIPATASLAETWETDGRSWTQMPDAGAQGRDHHTMVYDAARGKTVLFGGGTFGRGRPYEWRDDTREWDGVEWSRVATAGPGARRLVGMAYDRRRQHVVLFGGVGKRSAPDLPEPFFNDTWLWNGETWRKAAEGGPPARYGHAMAFDTRTGVALIYGGNTVGDQQLADMWQWDGQRWSEITMTGPTPGARFGAAMVHDIGRRRTVLYGGRRGEQSTWEWDGTRWEEIRAR